MIGDWSQEQQQQKLMHMLHMQGEHETALAAVKQEQDTVQKQLRAEIEAKSQVEERLSTETERFRAGQINRLKELRQRFFCTEKNVNMNVECECEYF